MTSMCKKLEDARQEEFESRIMFEMLPEVGHSGYDEPPLYD